jgi:hypothetical protein
MVLVVKITLQEFMGIKYNVNLPVKNPACQQVLLKMWKKN